MQNLINEIPKNQQFPDNHTFQWSEDLFNKIKQSEVFDSLPLSDLLILTKYATIVSIKKNCTLFKEGSYVPNLYVILDGNIDIIINDRVINTIGGYESLGEISFVDGHPVSADAITKTNCTLLIISKTKFHQVMLEEPSVGNKILWNISQVLANRLRLSSKNFVSSMNDTEAMALEKNKIIEVSKQKDMQIANMTHELRTPVSAIIGYVELLKEEIEAEESNVLPDIERLRHVGTEMLTLINNTLDLSKIEAGKLELNKEYFEATPFIKDVISVTLPLAQKNNNQLFYNVLDIEQICGDRARIKQILLNLVSNACKFTHDGRIDINISKIILSDSNQAAIQFQINDTGIGIEEDNINKLFTNYTQANSNINDLYGGTGLGLAICQQICQLMDGKISVVSEINKGSSFSLVIPSV
jgi:signal transduction histidine kinase